MWSFQKYSKVHKQGAHLAYSRRLPHEFQQVSKCFRTLAMKANVLGSNVYLLQTLPFIFKYRPITGRSEAFGMTSAKIACVFKKPACTCKYSNNIYTYIEYNKCCLPLIHENDLYANVHDNSIAPLQRWPACVFSFLHSILQQIDALPQEIRRLESQQPQEDQVPSGLAFCRSVNLMALHLRCQQFLTLREMGQNGIRRCTLGLDSSKPLRIGKSKLAGNMSIARGWAKDLHLASVQVWSNMIKLSNNPFIYVESHSTEPVERVGACTWSRWP